MNKFLETHNIPRLNHKQIKNLNRVIISNKINSINKKLPPPNIQVQVALYVNCTKHLKKS